FDVGGVDDAGQPGQGGVIVEVVLVDEDFEGALVASVGVGGVLGVEGVAVLFGGDGQDLVGRHVEDVGVGVDEPADEPWAGDAVGLRAGTGHPFHGVPPDVVLSVRRVGAPAAGWRTFAYRVHYGLLRATGTTRPVKCSAAVVVAGCKRCSISACALIV